MPLDSFLLNCGGSNAGECRNETLVSGRMPAAAMHGSGSRPCMHVILMRPMAVVVHFDRHYIDLPVPDLTYRHQLVGEFADFASRAAQDHRFHAIVVVEVDVH